MRTSGNLGKKTEGGNSPGTARHGRSSLLVEVWPFGMSCAARSVAPFVQRMGPGNELIREGISDPSWHTDSV